MPIPASITLPNLYLEKLFFLSFSMFSADEEWMASLSFWAFGKGAR